MVLEGALLLQEICLVFILSNVNCMCDEFPFSSDARTFIVCQIGMYFS